VAKTYEIAIETPSDMQLINVPTISVAPGEKRNVPFSVEALSPMANTMQSVSFVIIDKSTNSVIGNEVMFYSGNNRQM